ncbi:MAG: hypothetical protein WCI85_14005 [Comamonadaceae bacterium]
MATATALTAPPQSAGVACERLDDVIKPLVVGATPMPSGSAVTAQSVRK